jgi:lysyl-tRNA synthetase class II
MRLPKIACLVALGLSAPMPGAAQDMADRLNDYPTEARADYVFACMATNGQDRMTLSRCACSIDVIASILPYDGYVEAETVLMLQQGSGEQLSMFKTMTVANEAVARLRWAQAEAEILCF